MAENVNILGIIGGRNAVINAVNIKRCGFGPNGKRIEPDGKTCLRKNKKAEPDVPNQVFDLEGAQYISSICHACLGLWMIK